MRSHFPLRCNCQKLIHPISTDSVLGLNDVSRNWVTKMFKVIFKFHHGGLRMLVADKHPIGKTSSDACNE